MNTFLLLLSILSIVCSFFLGYSVGYSGGRRSYIREKTKRVESALGLIDAK